MPLYTRPILEDRDEIVGVGALGMTVIMISGGIDLSVGSVMGLVAIVAGFDPVDLAFQRVFLGGDVADQLDDRADLLGGNRQRLDVLAGGSR